MVWVDESKKERARFVRFGLSARPCTCIWANFVGLR